MKRYIVSSESAVSLAVQQQYNRFKLDYRDAHRALVDHLDDYDLDSCWSSTSNMNRLVQELLELYADNQRRVRISCAGFAGALYAIAECCDVSIDVFCGMAPHNGKHVSLINHVWAVTSDGVVWEKWPESSVQHPKDFDQYVKVAQFTPEQCKLFDNVSASATPMRKAPDIVGKIVYITNKDSWYYGEWGRVISQDGDDYYVAIAEDKDSMPMFSRDEFKVRR